MKKKKISFLNILGSVVKKDYNVIKAMEGLLYILNLGQNDKLTIGRYFEILAQKIPNQICIVDQGTSYTYREINSMSNKLARNLKSLGIDKNNVVSLLMPNCAETIVAILAIAKIGAISCFLNPNWKQQGLIHGLKVAKGQFVLTHADVQDHLLDFDKSVFKELNLLFIIGIDLKYSKPLEVLFSAYAKDSMPPITWHGKENLLLTQSLEANLTCFYVFTSGTTGLPKASRMTHYRFLKALYGMGMASVQLKKNDRVYCCLPLYHNTALTIGLGSVWAAGATLVLDKKFSAKKFWYTVKDNHITAFLYIGDICRYLLNSSPSRLDQKHNIRMIIGNGLRDDIWIKFKERFNIPKIVEFYGQSEGNLIFVNVFNLDETAGFCPFSYAVVEFDSSTLAPTRDNKGRLKKVKVGQVGLLITKVTHWLPYEGYSDPVANKKNLIKNCFTDGDQYLNSWDLVKREPYGHLSFVDRVGDTFRYKGENVATLEVEKILNSLQEIKMSVVYGIKVDGIDGRVGMAAIVTDKMDDTVLKKIANIVQKALPQYAIPKYLRLIPRIQLTDTYKVKKSVLQNEGLNVKPLYEYKSNLGTYVLT